MDYKKLIEGEHDRLSGTYITELQESVAFKLCSDFVLPHLTTLQSRIEELERGNEWYEFPKVVPRDSRMQLIGCNERGDMTILQWKHNCFFDGLTRVDNIVMWRHIPKSPITRERFEWKK